MKEALAQEQEPVAKYSDIVSDGGLDPRNTTPPQQEPWCMKMNGCKTKCEDCPVEVVEQEPVAWWNDTGTHIDLNVSGRGTPLYTTPPQRTWVGLTIEEIASCCRESTTTQLSFAQELEAKLKEKNT